MEFVESSLLGRILETEKMSDEKECSMPRGEFPKNTPYAMMYVPFQKWEKTYDAEAGLSRGTVFPSLDKPFIGEEAVKNGIK